ncbi:hypothetical protein GCM10008090_34770 [Arenicella chitinivorans]|uniref:Uncharacterized protein n=1 Tax=Arenicella chitinivorans TaxID=1329800 RepID=A0A918S3J3_9GAMM|nr:hypothetical protein [Arenicella chitinivorans]GHA22002.1 hypothetical protein GCM10008090_34770 [Arenicella chitinivorans]
MNSQLRCIFISALFLFSSVAIAQNKVVVVPIGSGSELKPIQLDDVLVNRMAFSQTTDIKPLFTTNSTFAYVITSMHVYFRANFPATRDSVAIRTRTASSLNRTWHVPNDTYSVIDFGTGYLFDTSSEVDWSIDVYDRGGYGTGISNFIYVDFYGYRVKK